MGKVILNDIRVYAFHGCIDEEEKIGSDYVVNLKVKTDLSTSSKSEAILFSDPALDLTDDVTSMLDVAASTEASTQSE